MTFTLLIIIALIGAAILAFICAWYIQQNKIDTVIQAKSDVEKQLQKEETEIELLKKEISNQKLTTENLQKQSETAENELIQLQTELRVMEGELKVQQRKKQLLINENTLLQEELKNGIKEIEVIREVPIEDTLGNDEADQPNKRIENAKRLVFAFKKGVSENASSNVSGG